MALFLCLLLIFNLYVSATKLKDSQKLCSYAISILIFVFLFIFS